MICAPFRRLGLISAGFVLLLGGCASSQSARFYLLTAQAEPAGRALSPAALVAVGPIEFPEYLNRPQIVTRGNGPLIEFAEFDRWAEPLGPSFARLVGENLAILLSTERVVPYPWKGSATPDYRVTMDVLRFDGTANGEVQLVVRWNIVGPGGEERVAVTRSRISVAPETADCKGIVQAMSQAVSQLCTEIAEAIQS